MGRTNTSAVNNTAVFSQLQAENDALKKESRDLRQKLERMNELLLNAQRARFGPSSEKQDYVMPNQIGIFNEAEAEQEPKASEPTEATILVPAHTRKPKRTMDELVSGLPVKEILIALPEEELICDVCGSKMVMIGKKSWYPDVWRSFRVSAIFWSIMRLPMPVSLVRKRQGMPIW